MRRKNIEEIKRYYDEQIKWHDERIEWCSKMIKHYGEEIKYYKNLPINDMEYKEDRIKYNKNMRVKIYKMRANWREQKEMLILYSNEVISRIEEA
jgi:hypothetical protein